MICSKCGEYNTPDSNFCTNCGTKLVSPQTTNEPANDSPAVKAEPVALNPENANASYVAQPLNESVPMSQAQDNISFDPAEAKKVNCLKTLKEFYSSSLILLAIITFGASLIFSLLYTANGTPPTPDFLQDDYYFSSATTLASNMFASISSLISMIPSIVLLIGFILIYKSAKDKSTPHISDSGFAILKTISIIILVLICLLFAFIFLMYLVLYLLSSEDLLSEYFGQFSPQMAKVVISCMNIFTALLAALLISISVNTLKTVNTMRKTAATGVPSDKVSSYVGVMFIIAGAISVLSSLPTFLAIITALNELVSTFAAIMQALSSICSGVYCISMGAIILLYKSEMKKLMN